MAVFFFAKKGVAFLDELTTKQRKFVAEYVKTGNATQSYINAGYKVKSEKSANAAAYCVC